MNAKIFAARKANKECFACNMHGELVPNQLYWECKLHGVDPTQESRSHRVPGSGSRTGRPA